jgi:hypothetical protein
VRAARSPRPRLRPDVRGSYRISLVSRGPAAGASAAASEISRLDTVTLSASDSYPLLELATLVPQGGPGCTAVSVRLSQVGAEPQLYKNPSPCVAGSEPAIHAVALNRATLELSTNKSFGSYPDPETSGSPGSRTTCWW